MKSEALQPFEVCGNDGLFVIGSGADDALHEHAIDESRQVLSVLLGLVNAETLEHRRRPSDEGIAHCGPGSERGLKFGIVSAFQQQHQPGPVVIGAAHRVV